MAKAQLRIDPYYSATSDNESLIDVTLQMTNHKDDWEANRKTISRLATRVSQEILADAPVVAQSMTDDRMDCIIPCTPGCFKRKMEEAMAEEGIHPSLYMMHVSVLDSTMGIIVSIS